MLVKICGIRTKEAAEAAVQAGADFIGFVFADSKRNISAERAAIIAQGLPTQVKKVGVFVDEQPERMIEIAKLVGLDYLQLHGDESADIASQLPFNIIKAIPAEPFYLNKIRGYPCDYYLIDSPSENRGGSGKTFNWELMEKYDLDRKKLLLAGGLTEGNVQKAIEIVHPIGVDVSSGVETNGEKDVVKIKRFIHKAKEER
ncbi:phosphoribosylanthranilate isomerase [Pallidibacillus thermolactis]|uniref:phosphoribosylanthranilate isomerase n=1 Tax=Pallidibacillus thermolactis TaxID=251051 RepID=UPI002E219EA2|nr:phosphoribosylanthranilate isomerase [Pallidibacillus thermolactis subsp. kokeshiiformis]